MYTVKLADGTELSELELNGNNFISKTAIDDSVFANNLSAVTITNTDTDVTVTYTDMELIDNKEFKGEYWFIIAEKSEQKKAMEKISNLITENSDNITDIQVALVELYETMLLKEE